MLKPQVPWEVPVSPGTIETLMEVCGLNTASDVISIKVLDFGCGNGRYLEAFAKRLPKKNLFGAEIDLKRIAQVRGKGFSCVRLGSEQSALPFTTGSFDIVFSSNVIEHIQRKVYLKCLREIHRIIKSDGRFVLGTPNYPIKRLYDIKKLFQRNSFATTFSMILPIATNYPFLDLKRI